MTESGMSYLPGSAAKSCGSAPARDQVQREVADHLAARGYLDDVAEDVVGGGVHVLDLLELLAEAEGDRPAGAGWRAGRRGSRGGRRGRSARAGPTRTARTGGAPPPSRARGRTRPAATGRSPAASNRWRPPGTTATAGWSCRTWRRSRRRPRRPRRRSRRAGWRAGRRGCRGCAGGPAGRTARAAPLTSVRAAGARSRPAMSLIARTCAPASDDPLGQPQVVVEGVEPSRPGRTGRRCSRARPRRRRCRWRGRRRWPGASG